MRISGGRPVVLDGGLATELERRGHDLSGALWSARLLRDAPEEIVAAHRAYFLAGAEIAVTASYQATLPGLAAAGVDRSEAVGLLSASVALARRARDEVSAEGEALSTERFRRGGGPPEPSWTDSTFGAADTRRHGTGASSRAVEGAGTQAEARRPGPPAARGAMARRRLLIAASIGPYGAYLADGSEYRGRYGLTVDRLRAFHRPRLEILAEAEPDLLAIETIPDVDEAAAVLAELDGSGLRAWLTFSSTGMRTRAGQPLAEAFAMVRGRDDVVAVGVNCSSPVGLADVVGSAAECSGKPVVVYPDGGEMWDPSAGAWTGPGRFRPDDVHEWIAAGARLVGGCCRVGPSQIAALAAEVDRGT
ncbi:homocysteine S-methyltransferase [Actinoalloteichus hoggarensis]|uniref:homocysteine S-methyltransferase n=1 Tax=Actinoalloteichus hoggarensis TaxID=1470176 RepID=UPI001FE84799|nr:homocysteine S-methyltransferase [Actinoalloteichus hoggarensis]